MLRVLALEPYYGGSHRSFLDGWSARSRHRWEIVSLPPRHWKWRMRQAAVTMASTCAEMVAKGARFDVLWCSDMLGLAEFVGVVEPLSPEIAALPRLVYFHESQFSYPSRNASDRDHHFAFTNFTSALAANAVWFNSAFHYHDFFAHCQTLLERMPDYQPLAELQQVKSRATVQSPGVSVDQQYEPSSGPLHIVWASRWEHDKNPDLFFAALRQLKKQGLAFRVSILGEQFRESPGVFDAARLEFADQLVAWGFQESREEFESALAAADVFVSTADHEFFGIAAVEAMLIGVRPLLPQRLAYPSVLKLEEHPERRAFFFDGSEQHLVECLTTLASDKSAGNSPVTGELERLVDEMAYYRWDRRAAEMDVCLESRRGPPTARSG